MENDYLMYYILSYFSKDKVTTIPQILHVFQGKRTPSMLYLAEISNWHHGFSQLKNITKEQLVEISGKLSRKEFIIEKEKGYLLTESGFNTCRSYFKSHYYPHKVNSFSNINARLALWNRLQLYTQVFSEFTYQNSQYVPIIKNPSDQENVRQLFSAFQSEKVDISNRWIKENEYVFDQLEDTSAIILANSLTGHQLIGKTRKQIAQNLEISLSEFHFLFLDSLEELIKVIEEEASRVPLLLEILKQVYQETDLGLSQSTYETYVLLKSGRTIDQIAKKRFLKANTIKEHILEIAFVFKEFPYEAFIPEEIHIVLNNEFDCDPSITYKEVHSRYEDIEFIHFRLTELERMRMTDE